MRELLWFNCLGYFTFLIIGKPDGILWKHDWIKRPGHRERPSSLRCENKPGMLRFVGSMRGPQSGKYWGYVEKLDLTTF